MKSKLWLTRDHIFTAVVAGLLSIGLTAGAQTVLRIHGSTALKALIEPNMAEITAKSGVNFELVGNGTENGLIDLAGGQADVAMLSIPLDDAVQMLNAKNQHEAELANTKFTPLDSNITSLPLGSSLTVLAVNRNNPLRKLSNQQAIDLLSGKIVNWKEVGGLDENVVVVIPPSGYGSRWAFETKLLKTEKFRPDAKEVPSAQLVRFTIADSRRAVGPVASSMLTDKIAAVTLDSPIVNELSFAVKGQPSPAMQKLAEVVKTYVK